MADTTERAVLAGGCFWGMQDLIRRYAGVISTRVGYSGGEVPNATYRNHGNHAEAIEIIFDPKIISYRQLLEFFFQIHDPSTRNRQGNDRGASYRSAIFTPATSRSGPRWTPSPTSMRQASGPARSSPRWRPPARSGRPSPSIRIIWRNIPTATPATSSGPTGSCRAGRRARAARRRRKRGLHPSRRPRWLRRLLGCGLSAQDGPSDPHGEEPASSPTERRRRLEPGRPRQAPLFSVSLCPEGSMTTAVKISCLR